MRAGVGVVGLDDIAEQEGGAAVGARELQRLVEAPLPLARGEADEEQERQRQDQHPLVVQSRYRCKKTERREREVDREDERKLRDELPGRNT